MKIDPNPSSPSSKHTQYHVKSRPATNQGKRNMFAGNVFKKSYRSSLSSSYTPDTALGSLNLRQMDIPVSDVDSKWSIHTGDQVGVFKRIPGANPIEYNMPYYCWYVHQSVDTKILTLWLSCGAPYSQLHPPNVLIYPGGHDIPISTASYAAASGFPI